MFATAAAAYQAAHEETLMTPRFTEAEREVIRDDVREAIIDSLALFDDTPEPMQPWDNWRIMGKSDPVHLPPLELEF